MSIQRVLVYGSKGALGSECVKSFKLANWWVISVATELNTAADVSILADPSLSWIEQEKRVITKVRDALESETNKLDAIVCVAGGWAGGNAASKDFIANCALTCQQSISTSFLVSSVACRFLNAGGLLVLCGAAAALNPTPTMIGYGSAKAAVHHLIQSLSSTGSGLPDGCTVVGILPEILDTPMNRKSMPKADTSTWTPLQFVAELLLKWSQSPSERPPGGSLVKLSTINNITKANIII